MLASKFEGCMRAAFKGMTFPTFDKDDVGPQTFSNINFLETVDCFC